MDKKRIGELTYFNAVACLGVLIIHTLSYGIANCTASSAAAAPMYFLWRIASCVVPAFLWSGAMKMSASFTDEPEPFSDYINYILGRLKKIVLPYFLWCIVYYAFFLAVGRRELSAIGFFREFFLGTLSSQFYYIVITVQFYLLRPLWKILVEKIPASAAIAFAVIITMISGNFGFVLKNLGLDFPYTDRIFTTYLVFWVAGLYAGRDATAFSEKLGKRKSWMILAAVGIIITAVLDYLQFAFNLWFGMGFLKIFSDILSILLLFSLCTVISESGSKSASNLRKFLGFVYPASFSIFLSHLLFVIIADSVLRRLGITRISTVTAAYALACTVPPYAAYKILSKCGKLLKPGAKT